jgi:predicted dehydrogenase
MSRLTRRTFLASSAAAALSSARAAPSERVNLCVVGCRGRATRLAQTFAKLPNAQVTHICDVNTSLFGAFGKLVTDVQKTTPKPVQDLRRVLEDRSVDAIVVATPDHWHALATIWACQAGKHVYVEKPVSHNVFEGRQMVAAARKYKRVVQAGTQSRSVPHYQKAMEYIRAGKLGKVHMAKAWNSQLRRRVPHAKDEPVPAGLDWDIWQGPAAEKPFNPNRYTYGWKWLWEYGAGDMGNDGVHDLDIARWGLGVEVPATVTCTGGKLFFDGDAQESPDTQLVTFTFPSSKAVLVYEQRLWSPYHQEGHENGVAFYGTEGYMVIGRQHWKVVGPRNKVVFEEKATFTEVPHLENFLACVKTGARPNCDIEEGHRSTLLAHLGNIAYRVGRPLTFDAKAENVVGDDEAAALTKRKGRKAFTIPERV